MEELRKVINEHLDNKNICYDVENRVDTTMWTDDNIVIATPDITLNLDRVTESLLSASDEDVYNWGIHKGPNGKFYHLVLHNGTSIEINKC